MEKMKQGIIIIFGLILLYVVGMFLLSVLGMLFRLVFTLVIIGGIGLVIYKMLEKSNINANEKSED